MFDRVRSACGTATRYHMQPETHGGQVWLVPQDVHHVESFCEVIPRQPTFQMGIKKLFGSLAVVATVMVGVSACSSSDAGQSPDTSIVNLKLVPASNVIDVRTAEEFAEGHVQGARNLDIKNGDFEAALVDLDKEASYSVYCRSGNRSATAVELMRNAGFTNVVDLGAVEEAAQALSLPIVQN